jgi:hypothetical protein
MAVKQPEFWGQRLPDTSEHFVLYHWSPKINRESIKTGGLRTRNPDLLSGMRLPFVSFALNPQLAWALSAARKEIAEHDEWDLWSPRVKQWEVLLFDSLNDDDQDDNPKEYRVYRNIRPDHIWLVGTRTKDM